MKIQEKMSIYSQIDEKVQPFFDRAREDNFGGLPAQQLSDAQASVYIRDGYAEFFKTIPAEEMRTRMFVFSRVCHYAKRVSEYWNEECSDVFEMCDLVTKK